MKKKNPALLNEEEKFQKALRRTYTERFFLLMRLIKINRMLQGAKIIYPNNIK